MNANTNDDMDTALSIPTDIDQVDTTMEPSKEVVESVICSVRKTSSGTVRFYVYV